MIVDDHHVVLVGLMGTGKSSTARLLAERLGRAVSDTDVLIEQRTGRSVRAIMVDDGEAAFRDLESDVLADVLAQPQPAVIAAGGGVVLRDANRKALREAGARVVWLSADVDTLVERVRGGVHRPLLDDDPEGVLRTMAEHRTPLYHEVADHIVRVDGRSLPEVVEAILR